MENDHRNYFMIKLPENMEPGLGQATHCATDPVHVKVMLQLVPVRIKQSGSLASKYIGPKIIFYTCQIVFTSAIYECTTLV